MPDPRPPLLQIILDELQARGWTINWPLGLYEDPEGNRYASIEGAITAETFREIARA